MPLPAAIPATCVPCLQPGIEVEQLTPAPDADLCLQPIGTEREAAEPPALEKQASATTFPLRNGWVPSTPVSRMATVQSGPV